MFDKTKYYAVFVNKQQNIYEEVARRKISAHQSLVSYKNKSYFIDTEKPTKRKGRKLFYFIDIRAGQMLPQATELKKLEIIQKEKIEMIEELELSDVIIDAQVIIKEGSESILDPETVDKIVAKNMFGQLIGSLSKPNFQWKLFEILIGVAIGMPTGIITMQIINHYF
jgi:hypothetical protein